MKQMPLDGIEANSPKEEELQQAMQLGQEVQGLLIDAGYAESSDSRSQKTFRRQVPYQDLYGAKANSAFVVHHPVFGETRIEPHKQQVSGSVDRKFPFFLLSAEGAPEHSVILLIEGQGHKPEAISWLRKEAQKVSSKNIQVMDLTEFRRWL